MGVYLRPSHLDQALEALSAQPLTILAGGTDYYPARVGQPLDDDILDITGIEGLRAIEARNDQWRIGALTTWTDLVRADLPACFDGLKQAAREVGGVQIQNAGTIVGNICNASPAADGTPNLMALDAAVELASSSGSRSLPLTEFAVGNRATAVAPDELVSAITIPKLPDGAASSFLKLGARRYLVISIVMIAIVVVPDGNSVGDARVAIGACAPTAKRIPMLESALQGQPMSDALGAIASSEHVDAALSPIDDVRGSAEYREDAALTLLRRGLSELGASLGGAA